MAQDPGSPDILQELIDVSLNWLEIKTVMLIESVFDGIVGPRRMDDHARHRLARLQSDLSRAEGAGRMHEGDGEHFARQGQQAGRVDAAGRQGEPIRYQEHHG